MRDEALRSESDDYLWQLVRENDEAAFKVLYQRYWQALYTTAFFHLRNKEACADIVHDIFISIWKRRNQAEIISFYHYLTNAGRYKVYKYLQAAGKNKLRNTGSFENFTGVDFNSAEIKFNDEALEQKLHHHLNELPKRCSEIFILSRKELLSNDEIARKLHISKRTVENQLTYALKFLRSVMDDLLI